MATCTQFNNPIVPILEILSQIKIPGPSEGDEGKELLEILQDIFIQNEEIPSRVVKLEAISQIENSTSQNIAALELLKSWREGDEIEQKETWSF